MSVSSATLRAAALWAGLSLAIVRIPAAAHPASTAGDPSGLSGALRCSGGSTMRPLVETWARSFEKRFPHARIEIDRSVGLAAGGFKQLLAGRADVVDFVREPFPAEVAAFEQKFGYPPLLVNVADGSFDTPHATDAIAVFVNAANPLRRLTLAQLDRIFSAAPRAGATLTTWGQTGLGGAWQARTIHVYGMTPLRPSGNPPGIVNYIERRVMHGEPFRSDLRVEVDRPGLSALQAIARAVARDPDGIGYGVFGGTPHGIRAVALARRAGGPYYAGGAKQVADRTYPLSRRIYFGLNSPPGRPLPPLIAAFLGYALSPAGQGQVAGGPSHFLPLTAAQAARSRQQIHAGGLGVKHQRPAAPAVEGHASYLTPSGAIAIVGYNDMREMLQSLDRLFEHTHPGVRFALKLEGTRTAPAALAAGHSLLAPMGAVFSPQELAAYRHLVGANPISFRIAQDSLDPRALSGPLAVFVPIANPIGHLTFEQLRRMLTDAHPRWGQFGLTGDWADRPVHPYGLARTTALGRFMRRRVLNGRAFSNAFQGLPESADVVRQVGADPLGMGFAAMNRASAAVRVVSIARSPGQPFSRGTRADILAGRYPLDRYLRIYVRIRPGGRLDSRAREYLQLALSPQGQRVIAAGPLGYLPLSERTAAAERAKLRALP